MEGERASLPAQKTKTWRVWLISWLQPTTKTSVASWASWLAKGQVSERAHEFKFWVQILAERAWSDLASEHLSSCLHGVLWKWLWWLTVVNWCPWAHAEGLAHNGRWMGAMALLCLLFPDHLVCAAYNRERVKQNLRGGWILSKELKNKLQQDWCVGAWGDIRCQGHPTSSRGSGDIPGIHSFCRHYSVGLYFYLGDRYL